MTFRPEREHIVAAAILREGSIFTLPRPARHTDIIRWMAERKMPTPYSEGQGFLTNLGRFVNRIEGALVAHTSGQTEKTITMLMTEDLW